MRSTIGILAIGGLLAHSSYAAPSVKNFIYIVPDGYGPASQTMARDYASLLENGQTPGAPVSYQLPADQMVSLFPSIPSVLDNQYHFCSNVTEKGGCR